jgi:hypothetical protein
MNPFAFVASKALADDTVVRNRRAQCDMCDKKKKEPVTEVFLCDECGCVIKAKTLLKNASCPLKKW